MDFEMYTRYCDTDIRLVVNMNFDMLIDTTGTHMDLLPEVGK